MESKSVEPKISIIIPAYNEMDSVEMLYSEVVNVLQVVDCWAEIIFIDDGSRDGTWEAIAKVAAQDCRVRAIQFRRNLGKAAALSAGFREARGSYIVTLDGDLQDDPREIPRVLAALESGLDVVTGWKKKRLDPWHKVWPSRVFNCTLRWLTGLTLHDQNCGLKGFRKKVVSELVLFGELHRFVVLLAYMRGFRVGEIEVRHRRRKYGNSKYGIARFLRGFLDLVSVRFMARFLECPFYCIGAIGLAPLILGLIGLGYLGMVWWTSADPIGGRPLFLSSVGAILFGTQIMTLGLLAELITWRFSQGAVSRPVAGYIRGPRRQQLDELNGANNGSHRNEMHKIEFGEI